METTTDRLKYIDVYPNNAGKMAQRLHQKKDDINLVRKIYMSDWYKPRDAEEKEKLKKERAVISYITTEDIDRDQEIVLHDGIRTHIYEDSGKPVFWGHSYGDPKHVIGQCQWISPDPKRRGLKAKTIFRDNQFSDDVYRLYTEELTPGAGPILKGFSIGFIPLTWKEPDKKDDYGDKIPKRIYTEVELLEYSCVSLMSNRGALTIIDNAYQKGLLNSQAVKKYFDLGSLGQTEPSDILEIEFEAKEQDGIIEVENGDVTKEKVVQPEDKKPTIGELTDAMNEGFEDWEVWREGMSKENGDEDDCEEGKDVKVVTKPEVTENYIRIPVNEGCTITATITISAKKGIKALYCGKEKKIHTYLFDINQWTMEEAKRWVESQKGKIAYECKICGKEFIDYPSNKRVVCSKKCQYKLLSQINSGRNHPQYKGNKEIRFCDYCGRPFRIYPTESRKFCSKDCHNKSMEKNEIGICKECGKEFTHKAYKNRIFCSRECSDKYIKRISTGRKLTEAQIEALRLGSLSPINGKNIECEDGHLVQSKIEAKFDNWLSDKNIKHDIQIQLTSERNWTCDFVLQRDDGETLWVEIDGMGNLRKELGTEKLFEEKIEYYKANDFNYLVITPEELEQKKRVIEDFVLARKNMEEKIDESIQEAEEDLEKETKELDIEDEEFSKQEAKVLDGEDEEQTEFEIVEEAEEDVETKAVIPFKDLGKAPESEAWDGPAEVAAAEVSDLKLICAWYDSENADVKSSYKLPHHKAKGHSAVWRGVSAAMGALLGARGGVQIADSDKKGVYSHLKKHYGQFDKEAPEFKDYEEDELKKLFPDLYPDEEDKQRDELVPEETIVCECIKCGHTMPLEAGKHCPDLKCPECGGKMRRASRPGPGKDIEENERHDFFTREELERRLEEKDSKLQEFVKNVESQLAEIKEGRVLSQKNRTLIKQVLDVWAELKEKLEELYNATEPPAREESKEKEADLIEITDEKSEAKQEKQETQESKEIEIDEDTIVETIEKAALKALSGDKGEKLIAEKISLAIKKKKGIVE